MNGIEQPEAGQSDTPTRREDPYVRVVSVTQSPLNAVRWMLTLSCGHEVWITSKTRPKRHGGIKCVSCLACLMSEKKMGA